MEKAKLFGRMKKRLGVNGPGVTIGVIALVIALSGGAYAASGALTGKQKKEVTKIAKKFAGAPGAQGVAGPAGVKGDKGDPGAAGKEGAVGKEGSAGKEGDGVVLTAIPKATPPCSEQGGVEARLKSQGAGTGEKICNGKEGSPWTAGGTLPAGAVETGAWAYTGTTANTNGIRVPISFAIPLKEKLGPGSVHFAGSLEFFETCGNEVAPEPDPGQLCVYVNGSDEFPALKGIFPSSDPEGVFSGEQGAGINGAVMLIEPPTGAVAASGAYAVSGP